MVLEVDTNEHVVRGCLKTCGVEHTVMPLIVGDFRFSAPDGRCLAVAERKTYGDLASSIETGRYAEQRTRLLDFRTTSGCIILYIIEGSPHVLAENKRKRVQGALENLVVRHNIPVLHTVDAANTAKALENLHKKFNDLPTDGVSLHDQALPRTRKGKMEDNMLALQLTVIPGVSLNKAQAITAMYPTMADLIHALDHSKKPDMLLEDISLGTRKLGPALSRKIYRALFLYNSNASTNTQGHPPSGAPSS
jgi:ERCC4-type nuclease